MSYKAFKHYFHLLENHAYVRSFRYCRTSELNPRAGKSNKLFHSLRSVQNVYSQPQPVIKTLLAYYYRYGTPTLSHFGELVNREMMSWRTSSRHFSRWTTTPTPRPC